MRCLNRAILLLFVILFLQIAVNAEIKSSTETYPITKFHRLIDMMPTSGLGFPNGLESDNDVWISITSGAATSEIIILAHNSVMPLKIAKVLEASIQATPIAGSRIRYSQNYDFTGTWVMYSYGRIFQQRSTLTTPVGKVINSIRKAGYTPHVLLRIPRWVTCDSLGTALYSTKNYRWYNASSVPESLVITAEFELPGSFVFYAIVYITFIPLVMLISIFAGILTAKNHEIPIGKRRFLFGKILLAPVFISMIIWMPFSFYLLRSGYISKVADLWFGTMSTTDIFPLLLPAPFLALLILFMFRIFAEKKLIGINEKSNIKAVISSAEKALNKKILLIAIISMLFFLGLMELKNRLPYNNPYKMPIAYAIPVLIPLSGPLLRRIFKKKLDEAQKVSIEMSGFDPVQLDADKVNITNRVEYIARNLGVRIKDITIDDSVGGRSYAQAMAAVGNRVSVSRKTLDILSTEELDFILTHEVAHVSSGHLKKMMIFPFFPLLIGLGCILWRSQMTPEQKSGFSFSMMMMLIIVIPLVLFPIQLYFSKRREYYADYLALKETRNLEAAQSALIKMMKNSPLPYIHEYEDISTHPKMAKRLTALRHIAEQIGLPTAGLHRPTLESEG